MPVARRRNWASVLVSKVISSFSLLPHSAAHRYPTVVVHMGDEVEMQLVRDYSTIERKKRVLPPSEVTTAVLPTSSQKTSQRDISERTFVSFATIGDGTLTGAQT
ncbi:MAG: hypothetical protein L0Y72_19135 [Gemmataceae bacterium]|nr:hypothetical protein [Gemmataceae bacterium]MCI0741165.1 hypothetical protein [Gemmataceae bacterium]